MLGVNSKVLRLRKPNLTEFLLSEASGLFGSDSKLSATEARQLVLLLAQLQTAIKVIGSIIARAGIDDAPAPAEKGGQNASGDEQKPLDVLAVRGTMGETACH